MTAPAMTQQGVASATTAFAPVPSRAPIGWVDEGSLARSRAGNAPDAIELLAARYPVIYRLVGDDSFRIVARRYMLSELARSSSSGEYGDTFPQFLRSRDTTASIEYVADIAELEMLRERARRAAHVTPMNLRALSALRIDHRAELQLVLHPSVFTVASRFPIVTVWESNRHDGGNTVITQWRAESALVARPLREVEVWRLPAGGHAFLNALAEGRMLSAALAAGRTAAPSFDVEANLCLVIDASILIGFRDRFGMITSIEAVGEAA